MVIDKVKLKKQEKYKLILEVAESLMLEKGLYSLNMDEIALRSNLAKGTLYLYFKSKEEIFAVLTLQARIALLKAFEKATLRIEDPIEQLRAIIVANYNFLKKNSLSYELVSFYEINPRQTETKEMAAVIEKISALVISIITKGQAIGRINRKIEPALLSFSMWGMTVGVMQLLRVKADVINSHTGLSEQDIVSNYLSVFETGIINLQS